MAEDAPVECGWCGQERPIAYVDVLDIPWCTTCYQDTFLENFTPEQAVCHGDGEQHCCCTEPCDIPSNPTQQGA